MPAAEPTCRPTLALAVLLAIAYLCLRNFLPLFSRPEGAAAPTATGLLGFRLRAWLSEAVAPLGDALVRRGIDPAWLTAVQIGVSVLVGLAYYCGRLFTAGWLLIGSGTLDVLDGYMARATGKVSNRGAFLDSVGDRYAELFPYAGLGFFYRGSWLGPVAVIALVGSLLVSYVRARAAALGVDCKAGMMQRPERYVVLGFGSIFDVIFGNLFCTPAHPLLAASLVAVAVLSQATAIERVAIVLRRLD